jgi:hypothetical protein
VPSYLKKLFLFKYIAKPYLKHRKHSMGLFSNTKGIGTRVIGSLNGIDAFPPTNPNLTHTKHSNEFATQEYLESKALYSTYVSFKRRRDKDIKIKRNVIRSCTTQSIKFQMAYQAIQRRYFSSTTWQTP